MNFKTGSREEPEINLIAFIDVLLVVLIFLMLSTTYSKFTELELRLPVADADPQKERPRQLLVTVGSEGAYSINAAPVAGRSPEELAGAMLAAAGIDHETVLVIQADANARHQSVITVLEAARRAGLAHVTFAAQPSARAAKR